MRTSNDKKIKKLKDYKTDFPGIAYVVDKLIVQRMRPSFTYLQYKL